MVRRDVVRRVTGKPDERRASAAVLSSGAEQVRSEGAQHVRRAVPLSCQNARGSKAVVPGDPTGQSASFEGVIGSSNLRTTGKTLHGKSICSLTHFHLYPISSLHRTPRGKPASQSVVDGALDAC